MDIKFKTPERVNGNLICPFCRHKIPMPEPGQGGDTNLRCPGCGKTLHIKLPQGDDIGSRISAVEGEVRGAVERALGGHTNDTGGGQAAVTNTGVPAGWARLLANSLNVLSGILVLWILYSHDSLIPVYISMLLPFAVMAALYFSKGAIGIADPNENGKPGVYPALLISGAIVLIWGIVFNTVNLEPVKFPMLAIGLLMAGLFYKSIRRSDANALAKIIIIAFAFTYGFGAALIINCLPDKSEPRVYNVKVIGKNIFGSGRGTTKRIKVSPWDPTAPGDGLLVSPDEYNRAFIGSNVTLKVRDGLLGIHWYTMEVQPGQQSRVGTAHHKR